MAFTFAIANPAKAQTASATNGQKIFLENAKSATVKTVAAIPISEKP